MTDKIAIRVRNLGKKYKIGGPQERYQTFREAIVKSLKAPMKVFHRAPPDEIFWALKDVSFDVEQGEVLGIIGRNGAGKSTLLKILSRITPPTEGSVEIHGRVGSLLEVGTGFHPEMTGRENIFLNGSILGMKKIEIEQKFDEIVKFSEIEKFIDTPVKRYSSGMYVRLAFAVAAHLEPEILIIDEVLAVGDAAFQKKCLGKMGDVAREGRTVLFVSHNMVAVQNLCKKGILLNDGKIVYQGDINNAITYYIQKNDENKNIDLQKREDRRGNQILKFSKVAFFNKNKEEIDRIILGQKVIIRIYYKSLREFKDADVSVAFNIRTNLGYLLTNLNSNDVGNNKMDIFKEGFFECTWPKFNLRSGMYDCAVICLINQNVADWIQSAFTIEVEDGDFFGTGKVIERSQGDFLVNYFWESFEVEK
jgi:lipopolysaccharide transport system ATP-binding protein